MRMAVVALLAFVVAFPAGPALSAAEGPALSDAEGPALSDAEGAAVVSPAPKGDAEFRAGWLAFAEPAENPGADRSFDARQQAKLTAIPHMEAAVAANPGNVDYQTGLAYVYLSAARYDKAKEAINKAIDKERRDPLLYLLRGQAEAALVQMSPEDVSKRAGPALTAFSRAAELDPKNALPLLQAASVAFDCDRSDDALAYLQKALARPECRLYRLPLPDHLRPQPTEWLRTWQYIQLGQWYEIISRCQNVAHFLTRLGQESEQAGNLGKAYECFRLARQVGGRIGTIQPHMFITMNTAIDVLEDAYANLTRVAKATGNKDAQRWEGEAGIVRFGRQELYAALQAYTEQLTKTPPPSPEEALKVEAKYLGSIIAGIGLPLAPDVPSAPNAARPAR